MKVEEIRPKNPFSGLCHCAGHNTQEQDNPNILVLQAVLTWIENKFKKNQVTHNYQESLLLITAIKYRVARSRTISNVKIGGPPGKQGELRLAHM